MSGSLDTNKEKYRQLCISEDSIPLFSKDWWLDAVCGEKNWDVALVEKGDNIAAALPYYINKKGRFKILSTPSLTQTLGPWLRPSNAKYANQLADQKKMMVQLIDQLPIFDQFSQNFHYSITNWLPFYWAGFKQTTRYTYVLKNLTNQENLWNGLLPNIRTDIKKATNRFKLKVSTDFPVDTFLKIHLMTFERQNKSLPYSGDLVHSIFNACDQRNACKIFFAVDKKEKIHAANFIIWDKNSAYYLMGGADPELRNSGATSFLMWESILFASKVTKKFDFEGSMIEPVEKFFRAFGGEQVPYFQVSKMNSMLLKFRKILKGLMNQYRK